ncbi:MAG TPA: hypothetical protein PKC49_04270 [Phycisphaerae bacterium]|nr:hypothetical protein [Phycisphaerae bacterium]
MLALEGSRRSIASGRIEWSSRVPGSQTQPLLFVSRYARNGDLIVEQRGNDDGWTVFDGAGTGISRAPQLHMINEMGVWYHQETSVSCRWSENGPQQRGSERRYRGLYDVRAAGIAPSWTTLFYARGLAALWPPAEDPVTEWRQEQYEDYFIVRGKQRSGATTTWYINAERGWNAERITLEFQGALVREVRCALRKFGDSWFPEEVRYYENGNLENTITVLAAELNRETDSPRFTLSDLGVEPGSSIERRSQGQQRTPREESLQRPTWNGERIITFGEWLDGVKAGVWQWGPNHNRIFGKSTTRTRM